MGQTKRGGGGNPTPHYREVVVLLPQDGFQRVRDLHARFVASIRSTGDEALALEVQQQGTAGFLTEVLIPEGFQVITHRLDVVEAEVKQDTNQQVVEQAQTDLERLRDDQGGEG